jgi:hypothetical protein
MDDTDAFRALPPMSQERPGFLSLVASHKRGCASCKETRGTFSVSGWTLWDRPDGISSAFRCDGEKMSAHRDKRALHIIPEAVSPLPGIVTMELGQALRSYRESWAFIAPWSWSIALPVQTVPHFRPAKTA